MAQDPIFFSIVLIFAGAAVLATAAIYLRQSLLVAYIALGVLLGPWGADAVADPALFAKMAHIGVVFLLFLLGLDLHPQELVRRLGEVTVVTFLSSAIFAALGFVAALALGLPTGESLLVGAAMMFSSTVIGVKLLPTTQLHHRHKGKMIISILLLQDILAVLVLLVLESYGRGTNLGLELGRTLLTLPLLAGAVLAGERWLLRPLMVRFDSIHEYLFLVALGWCLGIAHLAHMIGFSHEIGAFVAGVALAQSPAALFIVQNLKPVRDFFLIVFFFSVGAGLDLKGAADIALPALLLASILLLAKPTVFRFLLKRQGEDAKLAGEVGTRLGQASEFALLIAVLALETNFIGEQAANLIQITVLITFVASSTWIGARLPSPLASNARLRRD
ncbi:MAG: cation:proton antiporter [Pseudomonadota bacterium]